MRDVHPHVSAHLSMSFLSFPNFLSSTVQISPVLPIFAAIIRDELGSSLHILGGPASIWSLGFLGSTGSEGKFQEISGGLLRLKYATSPNSQIFTFTFLHCLGAGQEILGQNGSNFHGKNLWLFVGVSVKLNIYDHVVQYHYHFLCPNMCFSRKKKHHKIMRRVALLTVPRWYIEWDSFRPFLVHRYKKL